MNRNTYAVEQRLRLIDFLLHHYGRLNRAALMDYFGISQPQAAIDIKKYLEQAVGVCYDASTKAYVTTSGFTRVFP